MQHFIQANGVALPEISINSISVEDRLGVLSDSVAISIPYSTDIQFPSVNATLDVSLGTDFLHSVGTFIVNEVSLSGPPLKLDIRGSGINKELVSESWNKKKNRTWRAGTKLGDILNQLAIDHRLTLITFESIYDMVMPYIFQKAETDSSLLYRLLTGRDLAAKFGEGKMGIAKFDSELTASGKPITPLEVRYNEVLGNFKYSERTPETFGTVTAKFQDNERGGVFTVTLGDSDPETILEDTYEDENTATLAAQSHLNASRRKNKTLSFDMIPRESGVITGQRLVPVDFPLNIDDDFIISSVSHKYTNSYTLSVSASLKAG